MAEPVRIAESGRALQFAPVYAATELGLFADAGIRLEHVGSSGPGGSALADHLVDGTADVVLGGLWLPLLYRQLGVADVRPFAQICRHVPLALLGRDEPVAPFDLDRLAGRRVVLPMAPTSQWMYISEALKAKGIDLDSARFVRDLDDATLSRLWDRGYGDYYVVDALGAVHGISQGQHVAAWLGDLFGPVPWSGLSAGEDFLTQSPGVADRLCEALGRGLTWVHEADGATVAERIAPWFPELSVATLTDAVALLQTHGIWSATPLVDAESLDGYQEMMVRYGLLDHKEELDLEDGKVIE